MGKKKTLSVSLGARTTFASTVPSSFDIDTPSGAQKSSARSTPGPVESPRLTWYLVSPRLPLDHLNHGKDLANHG